MVNPNFTFTILDNGNLRISCNPEDKEEIAECRENMPEFIALRELTESYWTNGWGVHLADGLGQLSECEVIAEESTIEDDGSTTLFGRAWYHPNYMVESIIETIIEKGFIDLPLWAKFDNSENFKNPYLNS